MTYPKLVHRGPVTARETLRVESAEAEAKALDAGWSLVPASWGSPDDPATVAAKAVPAEEPRKVPSKKSTKDAATSGGR